MNSNIFIEVGQCGNQLGQTILNHLHKHYINNKSIAELEINFKTNTKNELFARAVCIDTEPKVINNCINNGFSTKSDWKYDNKSISYRHGGAGNNWAMGYSMNKGDDPKEGESLVESAINCIRREIELSDHPKTLITIHSLAGGTGSGLGARLTEEMEDFGIFRMNIAIGPYHFGEVTVQYYNALLSLSKLSISSDSIILFENEIAQILCKQMRNIERPSMSDINRTIAENLLPVFLYKKSNYSSTLMDNITHLCGHSGYKFLSVYLTPQTSLSSINHTYDSYSTLFKTIVRLQISGAASERLISNTFKSPTKDNNNNNNNNNNSLFKSLSSIITFHGNDSYNAYNEFSNYFDNNLNNNNNSNNKFSPNNNRNNNYTSSSIIDNDCKLYIDELKKSHSLLYSLSGDNPIQLCYTPNNHTINGYQRATSSISNSQSILPILQRTTRKASELFFSNAYLHQYTKYGIEKEDFIDSFRTLGSVINNYSDI